MNNTLLASAAVAAMLTGSPMAVYAANLTTLVNFNYNNGSGPQSGSLIADAAGNLFGTTEYGGASGYGTVFEIANTNGTYSNTPTTLASFNNANGEYPSGGLIADAAGDLFGTTISGGASGYGTVFEIVKTASGYSAPSTLATFNNNNGAQPFAGLLTDAAGDLFGTTNSGGGFGVGTVFEIAKTGSTYSALSTLVSFNKDDGSNPYGGLIADAAGDLFGTTSGGGASNNGVVFEIAKTGGTYSVPRTLASFNNANGTYPIGGLIADAAGDLFGTTDDGGVSGYGTVFEIAKTGSTYSALSTLVSFNLTNGENPYGRLIVDAAGNLFGTTAKGGAANDGTVFEIAKTGSTYSAPSTLVSFSSTNWGNVDGRLIADAAGNLFGTTYEGGAHSDGTVFEISNSGFVSSAAVTAVPEPASAVLLGAGLIGTGIVRRHRRKVASE